MRIIQIGPRFLSISTIGRTKLPISKTSLYITPNSQHILIDACKPIVLLTNTRSFHCSSIFYNERSKVEKTVKLLKKEAIPDEKSKPLGSISSVPAVQSDTSLTTTATDLPVVKRKSIWERIVHELKHYYNGFKLLFIETKIAFRLLRQVLSGHTLTRRERKQFTRTAADLFRLVPFSVFIIVPFMEFTLPIFLKLFPNMLPSTFQEADKEKEKLKKQLKAKLEVAKFLQDTLERTALKAKRKRSDDALPAQFIEFMKKIRSTGVQPSTEEIMKFSSLFENKSTLDHLDRPQLVALCKILGISSIGPDYYLRFTLHVKLRKLEADDKLIVSEGIDILTTEELQAACRERGMRSFGVSVERLRSELKQWLDLHLNERIPSTILLLSRALYLPENVSQEDVLKAAIQALPKAIDNVTAVKLAQVTGEPVDNTQRIEYVKREDEVIRKEKEDKEKTKISVQEEMKKKKLSEQSSQPIQIPDDIPKAEVLVDKAPLIVDKTKQETKDEEHINVEQFGTAIGQLVKQKEKEVHTTVEAIQGLKHNVQEYKAEVKELESITATKQLKHLGETRSAKALSKRIDKLVGDLDQIVDTLDKKQDSLKQDIQVRENTLKDQTSMKSDQLQQHKDFLIEKKNLLVSTQELVNTIRQLQQASNESNEAQILDIINQFDHNKDGFIEADEILKALELVGNENVQISKIHLKEILDLVRKEHFIQAKEKFEAKAKQQSILNSVSSLDKSQMQTKNI